MKKVNSAPSLIDSVVAPGTAARPVAARMGTLGAESRTVGDGGLKGQTMGTRATSVSPLAGMAHLVHTTNRTSVRTSAVAFPDVAPVVTELSRDLGGVAKSVEDEVVVESGLHVVGVSAGGCYERFGIPVKLAPPLSQDGHAGSLSDDDLELAMCMATPFEGGENMGLREQVQKSLDDLALRSEIQSEFELAVDSLAEMTLSDSDECTVQQRLRSAYRRRRRHFQVGDQMVREAMHPSKHVGKENVVRGNVVSVGKLKSVLKKALPQN